MYQAVELCNKPVIASVNGYALGGGFELVLACDIVVASAKAKLGLPEVKLGLIPGGGGVQKLARLIGPYKAKELLFSGRFIGAQEAMELRMVHKVVEPEYLQEESLKLASELAEQAPLALQWIKKLVGAGMDASLETAQAYDRAALLSLFNTADAMEGISAFTEKRPPQFTGR